MKTFKNSIYLLLMCTAVLFTACNKDDDNNEMMEENGGGSGSELFTAKVDGADWSADTDLATLIGGSLTTNAGITVLVAQGSTNSGSFINFTIIGYDGPGTYVIADDNPQNASGAIYGHSPDPDDIFTANSIVALGGDIMPGEITVTAQDANGAEGTFSFEALNGDTTVNVTDGSFKIVFDN